MKFKENDNVLVEHGTTWYPSRVLRAEIRNGAPQYFIHFMKWNTKYDMWVEEHIVKEDTPENQALLKATFGLNVKKLEAEQAVKAVKGKVKSVTVPRQRTPAAPKVKRAATVANDPTVDMDESNDDSTDFPGPLKRRLVHDWEQITRRSLLVPLPCEPTVSTILNTYVTARAATLNAAKLALTKEVCLGLEVWFNESLHTALLYNFERPQYFDAMRRHADKKHSHIYGAEHLVRMLSKSSQLLDSSSTLTKEERECVERIVRDFCKFLVESGDSWFSKTYQITDKEYFSQVAECNARIQQAATAAAKIKNGTDLSTSSTSTAIAQSS